MALAHGRFAARVWREPDGVIALLARIASLRKELAERASESLAAKDYERFNALLSATRRKRPRDAIILGLSALAPDQRVNRGELVELYDRLALAQGADGPLPPPFDPAAPQ